MKRRVILSAFIGAAASAVLPALSQAPRMAHLGVLANFPPSDPREAYGWEGWKAFSSEMRRLGWEEGRNLVLEPRFGMNDRHRYEENANELVAARVDVIYAPGDIAAAAAFKATQVIPIVMHGVAAVEPGYARSLAQPGGNVTGALYQALDFTSRELGLLKAVRPDLAKIGVCASDRTQRSDLKARSWQDTARSNGVAMVQLPDTPTLPDIEPMLVAARDEAVQALVLRGNLLLAGAGLRQINAWAIERKVLTYAGNWARGEVLLAYGPDIAEVTRVALGKLDAVLRGGSPARIPIEQPTKFELIINLKIAMAMDLTIPRQVMLSATEVIR
jgi:putative ABC transport system substrate-binding protein